MAWAKPTRHSRGRRRLFLGAAGLALTACAGSNTPDEWPAAYAPPRPGSPGLVALLVPGLSLSDVLVAAAEERMPNLQAMVAAGTLVEDLRPAPGPVYTLAETGADLLARWSPERLPAGCLSWDLGVDGLELGRNCPRPGTLEERAAAMAAQLQAQADAMLGAVAEDDSPATVLLADDAWLSFQVDELLADDRQPGYDPEAALAFSRAWRVALGGLDVALGRLLNGLDLARWSVFLISTGEVWPLFAALDPAEVGPGTRALDAGAVLELPAAAVLPEGEAWAPVQEGRSPNGQARRLQAPAGYAFAPTDAPLARGGLRPGGFLLAAGRGLERGLRVPALTPAEAGDMIADHLPGAGTEMKRSHQDVASDRG